MDVLVGSETIGRVEVFDTLHGLLVKRSAVGGSVEIQIAYPQFSMRRSKQGGSVITSENFVASFATENHLDTHGFDFATQKVHGCTSSDSGNIVGFEMVYHFWYGIQTFLNGEGVLVVDRSEIVSSLPGGQKIWRVFEADRERV
jgi:hypothetical protein